LGVSDLSTMHFDLNSLIQPIQGLEALEEPFSVQEVDNIFMNLPPYKSPGPDGFNNEFMKRCWPVIKNDFYDLCNHFYDGQLYLQSIDSPYITLVPKKNHPE
jgi:hypothetical protein